MSQDRIKGVLSPVVTPFNDDMSPDAERFIRHCKWLVSQRVGVGGRLVAVTGAFQFGELSLLSSPLGAAASASSRSR